METNHNTKGDNCKANQGDHVSHRGLWSLRSGLPDSLMTTTTNSSPTVHLQDLTTFDSADICNTETILDCL